MMAQAILGYVVSLGFITIIMETITSSISVNFVNISLLTYFGSDIYCITILLAQKMLPFCQGLNQRAIDIQ